MVLPATRTPADLTRPALEHPLGEAVDRLTRDIEWRDYRFEPGASGDATTIPASTLLGRPERYRAWQDRIARALALDHGEVPAIVPAATVLGHAADLVGWLGAALLHRDSRVPLATLDRVLVRLGDDGGPATVIVADGAFACLRDDPAAAHPDARPVRDERALAAVLRAHAVRQWRSFAVEWQPGVRLGPRLRWGALTDAIDTAPWSVSMPDDEARGAATAARILADAERPLIAGSRVYSDVDHHGRPFFTRTRHTCCFEYALPTTDACFSCPRTSRSERRARASEWPDEGPPD